MDLPTVVGGWKTIMADPPWNEMGGGQIVRGAQRHYPLMKTADIKAMPVRVIAADQAHLYVWTTNNFLKDALEVVEAWGFRYITLITWVKDRFGLGQYYRGQTEHAIFAVRGNLPYRQRSDGKRAQGTTVIVASRRGHSQKPDQLRLWVEQVSHPPYLELFARSRRAGWTCWGNEADGLLQESLPIMDGDSGETFGMEPGFAGGGPHPAGVNASRRRGQVSPERVTPEPLPLSGVITSEKYENLPPAPKDADCKEGCPVCPECGAHMEVALLPGDDAGNERMVCTDCGAWRWAEEGEA